jgi:hypothetical protein
MAGPIPSPYYGNNYLGLNTGATAFIGADPIYDAGGSYTYYVQYYKTVFGASGSFQPVSSSNPFPVTVTNGLSASIGSITNTVTIQGTPSGVAVPVSGSVVVTGLTASPVPVYTPPGCRVEITGGQRLSKLNDTISIFGPSGSTWIYANLVNTSGSAIGTTSNPVYVNIMGATINATINPTVGVTNDSAGNGLRIQGMSGGTNVPVQIQNTVTINDTNILSGMTAIYNQVVSLNSNLSSIGAARPSSFKTGRASSTFSTVVQVDSIGFTCQNGINIKALSTNTDFIYIGNTGSFTGSSTGYALDPGDETFLSLVNTNKVWIVAASGTQTITYMAS